MSFEVRVKDVTEITKTLNSDFEVIHMDDCQAVVVSGIIKEEDLVVFIPSGSIVPNYILQKCGILNGDYGVKDNVINEVVIGGYKSEGIIIPIVTEDGNTTNEDGGIITNENGDELQCTIGYEVSRFLGIREYLPLFELQADGSIKDNSANFDGTSVEILEDVLPFHIQTNVNDVSHIEDEDVVAFTMPKGHVMIIGASHNYSEDFMFGIKNNIYISDNNINYLNKTFVTDENNIYNDIYSRERIAFQELSDYAFKKNTTIHVIGMLVGPSIDMLDYDLYEPEFRVFGAYLGEYGKGHYMDYDDLVDFCDNCGFTMMPIQYRGPYDSDKMEELSQRTSVLSRFGQPHTGVLVVPEDEMFNEELGRCAIFVENQNFGSE